MCLYNQILEPSNQLKRYFLHILIFTIMVDWPGLLKFSLNHSDGTKKSQFKPMPQQDKKWLMEAINHFSTSEVRRIQQLLADLAKPELGTIQDEQNRNIYLEELQELIQSLDKGDTLYQLGGHLIIGNIIFNSKYNSNRIIAMRIFCFANQNDAKVQQESINIGSFECIQRVKKEQQLKVREGMTSCLSSLIRGENLQAKRIFIKIEGLEVIKGLILKNQSARIKIKCMNILRDLLNYDDQLHKTYNDLSSFNNTNSIKTKNKTHSLEEDFNKEVKDNLRPENDKYRGYTKRWLEENKEIKEIYEKWRKEQEENN